MNAFGNDRRGFAIRNAELAVSAHQWNCRVAGGQWRAECDRHGGDDQCLFHETSGSISITGVSGAWQATRIKSIHIDLTGGSDFISLTAPPTGPAKPSAKRWKSSQAPVPPAFAPLPGTISFSAAWATKPDCSQGHGPARWCGVIGQINRSLH